VRKPESVSEKHHIAFEVLAFVIAYRAFFAAQVGHGHKFDKKIWDTIDAKISLALLMASRKASGHSEGDAWHTIWDNLTSNLKLEDEDAEGNEAKQANCARRVLHYAGRLCPEDGNPLTHHGAMEKLHAILQGDMRRLYASGREMWGGAKQNDSKFQLNIELNVRDTTPKRNLAGWGIELRYTPSDQCIKVLWNRWQEFPADKYRVANDYLHLRAGLCHEILAHATRHHIEKKLTQERLDHQDGWLAYMALRREADLLLDFEKGNRKRPSVHQLEDLLDLQSAENKPEELTEQTEEYTKGWDAARQWYQAFYETTKRSEIIDQVCVFDGNARITAYALLHILTKIGLGKGMCRCRRVPCRHDGQHPSCALLIASLKKGHRIITDDVYEDLRDKANAIGFQSRIFNAFTT
jgi:hypothetical protein